MPVCGNVNTLTDLSGLATELLLEFSCQPGAGTCERTRTGLSAQHYSGSLRRSLTALAGAAGAAETALRLH